MIYIGLGTIAFLIGCTIAAYINRSEIREFLARIIEPNYDTKR
jgi:hypothetical protein